MNGTEIVIFSWAYRYWQREFSVWSYLSSSDPNSSTMRFAFQVEGETVTGLPGRADAVRQARERIDRRPAEPGQATPGRDAPQTTQGHPPQQEELALG